MTVLALIHSRPIKTLLELKMTQLQKETRLPSLATLIICPSNLLAQWKSEVEKCLGHSKRVIVVAGIREHKKLSWFDVMFADIILVSCNFFINQNYQVMLTQEYQKPGWFEMYTVHRDKAFEYFEPTMRKLIVAARTSNFKNPNSSPLNDTGKVNFEAMYFHRVVIDEFHEVMFFSFKFSHLFY